MTTNNPSRKSVGLPRHGLTEHSKTTDPTYKIGLSGRAWLKLHMSAWTSAIYP